MNLRPIVHGQHPAGDDIRVSYEDDLALEYRPDALGFVGHEFASQCSRSRRAAFWAGGDDCSAAAADLQSYAPVRQTVSRSRRDMMSAGMPAVPDNRAWYCAGPRGRFNQLKETQTRRGIQADASNREIFCTALGLSEVSSPNCSATD